MPNETVLVVEDEEDILELVRFNLSKEGYQVLCASSGEEGLKSARNKRPDLVLLDLMLPGMDGLSVCKQLKNDEKTHHIPVVMLTAKGEDADIVSGLELGADDYVTKPFSPRVLIARVRTIFRRKSVEPTKSTDVIQIHGLTIHPGRHEVVIDGSVVDLTVTEFGVLHFLARKPGWVFTRYQIVNAVKGEDYAVTDRSVDVQIVGLRRKLGDKGNLIETVRGVGYRFKEV